MKPIKEDSILKIISYLEKHLGKDSFLIADHWDADMCAIGLTHPTGEPLIYISNYNKPTDTFYVEIEKTGASDSNIRFETVSKERLLIICKEQFLTN